MTAAELMLAASLVVTVGLLGWLSWRERRRQRDERRLRDLLRRHAEANRDRARAEPRRGREFVDRMRQAGLI